MNSRTAVLSLISIKPHSPKELAKRLPYASSTVYEAVRVLETKGLLKREGRLVLIGDGFNAKKTADIHIVCLSHGIDPEFITRDSTLAIWRELAEERNFKMVRDATGYSLVTVKNVISHLKRKGLVTYTKGKPVVAVRDDGHPLNREIHRLLSREDNGRTYHYPGTIPFRESHVTPGELERILFDGIEEGISVRETGFLVKNDDVSIRILESTEKVPSLEEFFLKKLLSTEGAEDICIKILKTGDLDFDILISISRNKKLSSIVGCYLDILKNIDEEIISPDIIERFHKPSSKENRRIFLEEEKQYGKSGWEKVYEDTWNVDLYLDLDAVKHGVRSS